MSDISDLERRLSAALARIGEAAEALRPQTAQSDVAREVVVEVVPDAVQKEMEQLRHQLMSAQTQLAAQDTVLNDQSEELVAMKSQGHETSDEIERITSAFSSIESHMGQLTASNTQLRQSNADLRDANASGVGNADLINASLQIALDSLTAERAIEKVMLEQMLAALNAETKEGDV